MAYSQMVICPNCGEAMHKISIPLDEIPYGCPNWYYECYDCGMMVSEPDDDCIEDLYDEEEYRWK